MKETMDFQKSAIKDKVIVKLGFKTGIINLRIEFEDIYPSTEGRVIKLTDKPTNHYCLRMIVKALFWNIKQSVTFLV